MNWRILVAAVLLPEGLTLLRGGAVDYEPDIGRETLLAIIPAYDAVVVRGTCPIDRTAIDRGAKLKVIGTAGVGTNHIDVDYARQRGVRVVSAAGANADSVAELTIALMICACRGLSRADREIRQTGVWDKNRYLGTELAGKTLGLVGLGQIGGRVAAIAQAMRMRVAAFDPYADPGRARASGVTLLPLNDLLRQVHVVSLHVPLTPETRNLITACEMGLMRPGAYLLNLSRGEVVDEEALADALESGHLAAAAADVVADEPKPGGQVRQSRLIQHPNFVVTPHIGAWTAESQTRQARTVAERVLAALQAGQDGSGC